jgi:SAM-dependent methyltransferase
MSRYSYSSAATGIVGRLHEFVHLARGLPKATESTVKYVRRVHVETQARVLARTGMMLAGKKVLDIGPGQQLGCLRCFSIANDVVAIDTDVIPRGFDFTSWIEMLRHNTGMRVMKTLGRKALGVDRRIQSALARAMGVREFPPERILRMSATKMEFESDAFDFVYSHSVFEHIDDPEAALKEVRRVLRPGGVAYISVHLYNSHAGAHDPRIFAQGSPKPPLWPHLRPQFARTVRPGTYLNRLSLADWHALFDKLMPGVTYSTDRDSDELVPAIRAMRERGELLDYSDDELLTVNLIALWQKPVEAQAVAPASSRETRPVCSRRGRVLGSRPRKSLNTSIG